MNENIDLTKILKDCPRGKKFYSTVFGTVEFDRIDKENSSYPIALITIYDGKCSVTADGRNHNLFNGECTLFPSKYQRDWSKFTAPWYKKAKFDPKTLQPYDKVLVRDSRSDKWRCQFFSHLLKDDDYFCACIYSSYRYSNCIPYNEDTKPLVGTTKEAPEYYRYWEE